MKKLDLRKLLFVLLLGILTACGTNSKQKEQADTGYAGTYQTKEEALLTDMKLIAEDKGVPLEDVQAATAFQDAFDDYTGKLMTDYEDQISDIWVDPTPAQKGYVRFVGEVPAELTSEISLQSLDATGLLTDETIELMGDGILSAAEAEERTELMVEALEAKGYDNFTVGWDHKEQVTEVNFVLPEGAHQPTIFELRSALQHQIASQVRTQRVSGRAALVNLNDITFTVTTGDHPIIDFQSVNGDQLMRRSGTNACTSGWSVNGRNGDGIITAHHCNKFGVLNQVIDLSNKTHTLNLRKSAANRDVAYFTTSGTELPYFYISNRYYRPVESIRYVFRMKDKEVCIYGRATQRRSCGTVTATGKSGVVDGTTVLKLAQVRGTSTKNGDSGGGWSFGNQAWGTHVGVQEISGVTYRLFMPAREAQSALKVRLLVKR